MTEKAMSRHVQLARYISVLITQRYGTLGPSNSSFFFLQRRNVSFFTSSDQTTIGELKGCVLYIEEIESIKTFNLLFFLKYFLKSWRYKRNSFLTEYYVFSFKIDPNLSKIDLFIARSFLVVRSRYLFLI